MKIGIKNKICARCVQAESQAFASLDIQPPDVRLGEAWASRSTTYNRQ
ncbi:hypothetical protein ACFOET_17155 [Parapedobacter deserti]|uniref:Uncharacterized protein n=1 Tax=Parapedobacter deserti TaxID=1912957 RepID=A0ABV7JMR0_9SPHI